ncbi:hypothetical protein [Shewanella sp. GXUN23E]|uniref:hypothetical protein n=1 Tax=Shewanella sp. GXUN23E TaxID=3422498 RepID=UPI003D7CAF86
MYSSQPGQVFRLTAVFSMIFALIGFSYNVWRMEVTEQNATVRDAAFEILKEVAELELIVYAAHYDADSDTGNPRRGWVKVGLIEDLALLMPKPAQRSAAALKQVWQQNWGIMGQDEQAAMAIVSALDRTRSEIRQALITLE